MNSDWARFFEQARLKKQNSGQLRQRATPLSANRDKLLDFGSNDYLGLRGDQRVLEAFQGAECLGSGASPVLRGYTAAHQRLETSLAELSGSESALVFSSGYAANVGVISCLVGEGDLLLSDQLNHASLIDGCRLSKAQTKVYPHNHLDVLADYLQVNRHLCRKALIVTESVFSMDGDAARLAGLVDLANRFNCGLIVDEAHAMGIYGPRGSGLLEEWGLQGRVLAKLGTMSKALGSIGGYVCGSHALIEYLVNHCRSYIFSTAPSVAVVAATRVAVEQIPGMQAVRERLRGLSGDLRRELRKNGWQVPKGIGSREPDDSPIVPVLVGDERRVQELSHRLWEQGIYVPAIRPPTVPSGTSRLRISLSARHSQEDISRLVQALATPKA